MFANYQNVLLIFITVMWFKLQVYVLNYRFQFTSINVMVIHYKDKDTFLQHSVAANGCIVLTKMIYIKYRGVMSEHYHETSAEPNDLGCHVLPWRCWSPFHSA